MIPDFCAKCQSAELEAIGAGTESVEDELPGLIPEAKILRLDRDQITSATRLETVLDSFREGRGNVLLGTQMLVKGHDFPKVTLVVVVMADALFRWPDFRAPERALQVLKQVAGRAGRGEKPGKVLIQTYQRNHPVIQVLEGQLGEDSFLETERQLRQALGYPPFGRIARIRVEHKDFREAKDRATAIAKLIQPLADERKVDVLGPSEAFLEKAKGIFRWDLLIKATEVQNLQRALLRARDLGARQKWQILLDVDPYGVG
jgi:primosomal protein N' (replication factor Y)